MFFAITPGPLDNFPNRVRIGNFWFNHDNGWHQESDSWHKGYPGNFCRVVNCGDRVILEHDAVRTFPLWYDQTTQTLTNLDPIGESIWATERVILHGGGLERSNNNLKDIVFSPKSAVSGHDIVSLLKSTFQKLYVWPGAIPKKLFLTGGLDTMSCAALCRSMNEIEFLNYEYIEYDFFTDRNLHQIKKKFWGYTQIHHWKKPTLLITGGCGDEFMMRGPLTVAIWAAWHDLDISSLARSRSECYQSGYYLYPHKQKIFQEQWQNRHELREKLPTYQDLIWHLLNNLANDHQHWHLGNTITFTPFCQIELTNLVLHLPYDQIIEQMLNGEINRQIARDFWPELEQLVAPSKHGHPRKNMPFFQEVMLTR